MFEYNIQIEKYGFYISFHENKEYSGFYWIAKADQTQNGLIDFSILGRQKSIFVETAFTPFDVDIIPVFSDSKKLITENCLIQPGEWSLQFVNIIPGFSKISIFGAEKGSYEAHSVIENIDLSESKLLKFDIITYKQFDKLFVKKSLSNKAEIKIGDFKLINKRSKNILFSDETLIKPESDNISLSGKNIIFEENCSVWSFFSIKFYEN